MTASQSGQPRHARKMAELRELSVKYSENHRDDGIGQSHILIAPCHGRFLYVRSFSSMLIIPDYAAFSRDLSGSGQRALPPAADLTPHTAETWTLPDPDAIMGSRRRRWHFESRDSDRPLRPGDGSADYRSGTEPGSGSPP